MGWIATRGLGPLLELEGLEHVALRKRLVGPRDVARMRERWRGAEIVVD